jgi:hypothetical protein
MRSPSTYIYMSADLLLLAKEQMVLEGMNDKLNDNGRCYGMEMDVKKNYSNENLKTTTPNTNYDLKKNGEFEIFQRFRQHDNK